MSFARIAARELMAGVELAEAGRELRREEINNSRLIVTILTIIIAIYSS